MNNITLVGRVGADPEVRYLESGKVVGELRLAVNRRSRDDEPDWFNIKLWNKDAQVAADYVRKGSLIGVIGRLENEKWTDRASGEQRSKPVIVVSRLELLGPKPEAGGAAKVTATAKAAGRFQPHVPLPAEGDEIPF